MIAAGRDLINRLDKVHFTIDAFLWIYNGELDVWRLLIATPEVKRLGPIQAYKKIQSIVLKTSADNEVISLSNISVVDSNYPLISVLRKFVKIGPATGGVRLSRNTINGFFIEDAYIYRIK